MSKAADWVLPATPTQADVFSILVDFSVCSGRWSESWKGRITTALTTRNIALLLSLLFPLSWAEGKEQCGPSHPTHYCRTGFSLEAGLWVKVPREDQEFQAQLTDSGLVC